MPHNLQMAESQEQGNSCRSATERLPPALREFPRASAETSLRCAAGLPAPAPSLPSQASHPLQVSTCPCFPFHPMQIPHHSHFLLTETRFYWFPLPPLQNRQYLLPSDLSFCCALNLLPFQGLSYRHTSLWGEDRFYPAGLVPNMGKPCSQPIGSSIYNIYNTSWYNDTHK